MTHIKNIATALAVTVSTIAAISCGSSNEDKKAVPPPPVSVIDTAQIEGKTVLALEGNDLMKYNKKELKAKVGIPIKLVLVHTGKVAKNAMGHNVVVLKEGTDVAAFVNAAASAVGSDYIPKNHEDKIIAHTKMLGGGEHDAVEFTIDKAGSYVYLCSFPGHSAIMRGILIVEE